MHKAVLIPSEYNNIMQQILLILGKTTPFSQVAPVLCTEHVSVSLGASLYLNIHSNLFSQCV